MCSTSCDRDGLVFTIQIFGKPEDEEDKDKYHDKKDSLPHHFNIYITDWL